jgi:hypothetical protein
MPAYAHLPLAMAKTGVNNMAEDKIITSCKAILPATASFGFGSSPRDTIAPSHSGNDTPGPGAYNLKSTLSGHVADSRIRSTICFSLRGREGFGGKICSKDRAGADEPGPGAYLSPQSRKGGLLSNPKHRAAPQFSFPKGCSPRNKLIMQPGPGHYYFKDMLGPQFLSSRATPPVSTFGKGRKRQSFTSDLAPDLTSSGAGPGFYNVVSACGKQVDSRKRNGGGVRFGKAEGPSTSVKRKNF